jgi:hypothetical protein
MVSKLVLIKKPWGFLAGPSSCLPRDDALRLPFYYCSMPSEIIILSLEEGPSLHTNASSFPRRPRILIALLCRNASTAKQITTKEYTKGRKTKQLAPRKSQFTDVHNVLVCMEFCSPWALPLYQNSCSFCLASKPMIHSSRDSDALPLLLRHVTHGTCPNVGPLPRGLYLTWCSLDRLSANSYSDTSGHWKWT